ncbi:MAG: hypothetical protein JWQ00_2576 [Noviherbaspirillum sp.]|nr:hypothetical protein [Noviherbaspirillum sp.]
MLVKRDGITNVGGMVSCREILGMACIGPTLPIANANKL